MTQFLEDGHGCRHGALLQSRPRPTSNTLGHKTTKGPNFGVQQVNIFSFSHVGWHFTKRKCVVFEGSATPN